MIKNLLGTTALLSVALFAGSAQADVPAAATTAAGAPKLQISGQGAAHVWFFKNNNKATTDAEGNVNSSAFDKRHMFSFDDARIRFDVSGKAETGLEYGLVYVVDAESNKTKNLKESYITLGGSWGHLYAGNHAGVEDTMAFGGFDPLGGTGGFGNSDFDRVVNYTSGTVHSVDLVGETGKATKVTYLTPRVFGVQAGISYTPKAGHRGKENANVNHTEELAYIVDKNNIAAGLNFVKKFNNGFELSLSGTGVFAKRQSDAKANFQKARSFALGTLLSYQGVSFGFEWGHNGKSHEAKGVDVVRSGKGSQFIDTGLSYTFGATKLSAGYFNGWRKPNVANTFGVEIDEDGEEVNVVVGQTSGKKARTHIITAAIDHKVAPGLVVYFEYAYHKMKNPGLDTDVSAFSDALDVTGEFDRKDTVSGNNKNNAFVIGSRIVF